MVGRSRGRTDRLSEKMQLIDEAYQKLLKSAVEIEREIAWDSEAAGLPVGAVEAVMQAAGRR